MDAPGTRYKVVERGRRLEVIDTWNGNAPVRPVIDPVQAPRRDLKAAAKTLHAAPVESVRRDRLDQRGRGLLHTKPWFDAKGPRQIVLTEAGEAKLKGLRIGALVLLFIAAVTAFVWWPLLFIVPFLIFREDTRKALLAAATKFLDELNRPGSG